MSTATVSPELREQIREQIKERLRQSAEAYSEQLKDLEHALGLLDGDNPSASDMRVVAGILEDAES